MESHAAGGGEEAGDVASCSEAEDEGCVNPKRAVEIRLSILYLEESSFEWEEGGLELLANDSCAKVLEVGLVISK